MGPTLSGQTSPFSFNVSAVFSLSLSASSVCVRSAPFSFQTLVTVKSMVSSVFLTVPV
ncbi:MAG: hypothetical protein IJ131_09025 [Eggerthellaceae bacterium]|nr:hypothetical protein [Eggerthellaceae bacterium]